MHDGSLLQVGRKALQQKQGERKQTLSWETPVWRAIIPREQFDANLVWVTLGDSTSLQTCRVEPENAFRPAPTRCRVVKFSHTHTHLVPKPEQMHVSQENPEFPTFLRKLPGIGKPHHKNNGESSTCSQVGFAPRTRCRTANVPIAHGTSPKAHISATTRQFVGGCHLRRPISQSRPGSTTVMGEASF